MLKRRAKKQKNKLYSIAELGNFFNLAISYHESGDHKNSEKYYTLILNQLPNHADSLHYLGLSKYATGDNKQAIELIKKSITIKNNDVDYFYNLGIILSKENLWKEARENYKKAIHLSSQHAMAHNNLSVIEKRLSNEEGWESHCKTAYQLSPNSTEIINTYANYLEQKNQIFPAIKELQRGLLLNPDDKKMLANITKFLCSVGDITKAREYLSKLEISDCKSKESSHLKLFFLNYDNKMNPEEVFQHHLKFGNLLSDKKNYLHYKLRDHKPKHKLRIGYISSDFNYHSVAYFIEPILREHNNEKFTVYCYSNSKYSDKMTEILKKHANHWNDIFSLTEKQIIQQILNDNIDILVDLSGYTAGTTINIFAHRIAPIQITYLGYPNTTGLQTVDYRITDYWADPIGQSEHINTEQLARLDDGFLCYSPNDESPDVGSPPMMKNGYITFASFNNLAKLNDDVIKLWSSILHNVENSKLLLKSKMFLEKEVCNFTYFRFEKFGVSHNRIILKPHTPDYYSHISLYNEVDIALDPFPYNGTTTTSEALWMGIPVITLQGNAHISRVTMSILCKLGLTDFIASSPENYKTLATDLSKNGNKLSYLRKNMRHIIKKSNFTNGKKFTLKLESLYQKMWAAYIELKNK